MRSAEKSYFNHCWRAFLPRPRDHRPVTLRLVRLCTEPISLCDKQ